MVLGSSVLLLTACGGDDTNDEGATMMGLQLNKIKYLHWKNLANTMVKMETMRM